MPSSLERPPPAPPNVQNEYHKCKAEFEEAFKNFHTQVFKNKVLEKNKSAAVKNTEMQIIEKLIKSSVSLDNVNIGEGTVALISTMIRELLVMRDRVNELEYDLCVARRDLQQLHNDLGGSNVKKK
jgi:hypothetical protein